MCDINTCNLCTPYLRDFPGSDDNILAITHEERFQHAVTCYRDKPFERRALLRERERRRRLGLLPTPNPCRDCGRPTWHDRD